MSDLEMSSRPVIIPGTSTPPRRFGNREAEANWTVRASTPGGSAVTITPAFAVDRAALKQFFDQVTPEDMYFRFLSGMRKVDDSRITAMLREDDDFSIDFLALDQGTGDILASAMLVADAEFDSAEFAVCTRQDAKHKGISWALLAHAANYAKAMGIRHIFSVQSANQAEALQLERVMGFTVRSAPDDPLSVLAEKLLG